MAQEGGLDLNTVVVQTEQILTSAIDDETVLANIKTGKYYGFDALSSHIWQLLSQARPLSDVCEQLLTEYEVDQETCQGEVLAFVQKLVDTQLVQIQVP